MKKTLWIVVGVVVVVAVVWFLQKKVPAPYSYQTSGSPTPSAVAKKGTVVTKGTVKLGEPAANTTYTELVKQYVGRLIQFDDLCKGTPGQLVVKKGTKVMLDNRSNIAKTILLDGQTINLPGYSYNIVTITTNKTLPYSVGLDCKSKVGAGENTVTVQIEASILQQLR